MNLLGEAEKAYEFFKAHPWIQGHMELSQEGGMGYCTAGVCAYYDNYIVEDCHPFYQHVSVPHRHESPHYYKLTGALAETLAEMIDDYFINLIDWNDAEGRTVEEVNELWVNTINRLKKEQEEYVPVSA